MSKQRLTEFLSRKFNYLLNYLRVALNISLKTMSLIHTNEISIKSYSRTYTNIITSKNAKKNIHKQQQEATTIPMYLSIIIGPLHYHSHIRPETINVEQSRQSRRANGSANWDRSTLTWDAFWVAQKQNIMSCSSEKAFP